MHDPDNNPRCRAQELLEQATREFARAHDDTVSESTER